MNAYLDTVICSGLERGDLRPQAEMEAARTLKAAFERGELSLVTSVEAWREQEKTSDPDQRAILAKRRQAVPRVAQDHTVLGFAQSADSLGGQLSYPLVTDVVDAPLLESLRDAGLAERDAMHVMYAVHNKCCRFVTLDEKDILPMASQVEAICTGLKIVRPTQLVDELGLGGPSGAA